MIAFTLDPAQAKHILSQIPQTIINKINGDPVAHTRATIAVLNVAKRAANYGAVDSSAAFEAVLRAVQEKSGLDRVSAMIFLIGVMRGLMGKEPYSPPQQETQETQEFFAPPAGIG